MLRKLQVILYPHRRDEQGDAIMRTRFVQSLGKRPQEFKSVEAWKNYIHYQQPENQLKKQLMLNAIQIRKNNESIQHTQQQGDHGREAREELVNQNEDKALVEKV